MNLNCVLPEIIRILNLNNNLIVIEETVNQSQGDSTASEIVSKKEFFEV